ncbi:hypothetical protein [Pedobacter sp.]|jgi:hypothetical protein|uniref:hypothetical protein n=1 Tax=Pedobacter sp. TaxID=1411316 RepID=UPI002D06B172|nr:hypothetical protein [Pedobacter sp.]HWW40778.1 hypothetical protein [Pedobacter sp.]
MKKLLGLLFFNFITIISFAQTKESQDRNPIYFLDSVRINPDYFRSINPKDIAFIQVVKENNAIERLGEEGKNGIIYIETKTFARKKMWNYLKRKSDDYARLMPTIESDSSFQYILNKKLLKNSCDFDLASVNDVTLQEIKILDRKALKKDFNVNDKDHGILILTEPLRDSNKGNRF